MKEFVIEYLCIFVSSGQAVNCVGECFLNLTAPRIIWKERTYMRICPQWMGL